MAISRVNRSDDTWAAMSGGSTFTTTSRPSARSRATNTRDMPPPVSSRSTVKAVPSAFWRVVWSSANGGRLGGRVR